MVRYAEKMFSFFLFAIEMLVLSVFDEKGLGTL